MLDDPRYLAIRPRVITICPQHSMVGRLLCHEENVTIVESRETGAAAHDGFTWEVLGTRFVRCGEFSRSSRAFEASVAAMTERMDGQERRDFTEELFGVLGSTGAVTLTDLNEHRLRQTVELARQVRHSPAVTRFITEILESLIREYVEDVKEELPDPRRMRRRKA